MNKTEILNKIKEFNKTILKIKLQEKANEKETNFDKQYSIADILSTAKEVEAEILKNELFLYAKNNGVIAFGGKMLDECNLTELIQIVNRI